MFPGLTIFQVSVSIWTEKPADRRYWTWLGFGWLTLLSAFSPLLTSADHVNIIADQVELYPCFLDPEWQRNREGKIIVLYDEDERLAPLAATTLVERGYENLFLLSGGQSILYVTTVI